MSADGNDGAVSGLALHSGGHVGDLGQHRRRQSRDLAEQLDVVTEVMQVETGPPGHQVRETSG